MNCAASTRKGTPCSHRGRYLIDNRWYCKTHAKVLSLPEEELREGQVECPICMTEVLVTRLSRTVCEHTFCKRCLNKWLRRNHTCPICRHVLRESPVVTEFETMETLARDMIMRLFQNDRIHPNGDHWVVEWIDIDEDLLEHWNHTGSQTIYIV